MANKFLGEAGAQALVDNVKNKLSCIVLDFAPYYIDGSTSVKDFVGDGNVEKFKSAIEAACALNGIIAIPGGIMCVGRLQYGGYGFSVTDWNGCNTYTIDPNWNIFHTNA